MLSCVSMPGGGKLVLHLWQQLGVGPQNLRQVVLCLSQKNMGLRGQCRNKQTIQSTHLQHLVMQTAEDCPKDLILLTGADFLMHTHIVFIKTVGPRLHFVIVAPNIQQEPVTTAQEVLNENVLSCLEVVLTIWIHCSVIMRVATMK